jgi:hypothetical protein
LFGLDVLQKGKIGPQYESGRQSEFPVVTNLSLTFGGFHVGYSEKLHFLQELKIHYKKEGDAPNLVNDELEKPDSW